MPETGLDQGFGRPSIVPANWVKMTFSIISIISMGRLESVFYCVGQNLTTSAASRSVWPTRGAWRCSGVDNISEGPATGKILMRREWENQLMPTQAID